MDEEQLDAHLDTVLIGGRERREIVIAEYDPQWPGRFDAERERIGSALGDAALRIEHIGSTSVPGLAAKPIVDVLVAVSDVSDESSYGPALERAGYELRVREPEHRMYRTPERDVHVGEAPGTGGIAVPASELSRGLVIGVLERAIVLTLVLLGQFGALGLVIAAKALTRFRALDDRDFAEYVLIGTLASLLFALLIGIAVRFVMFWG